MRVEVILPGDRSKAAVRERSDGVRAVRRGIGLVVIPAAGLDVATGTEHVGGGFDPFVGAARAGDADLGREGAVAVDAVKVLHGMDGSAGD